MSCNLLMRPCSRKQRGRTLANTPWGVICVHSPSGNSASSPEPGSAPHTAALRQVVRVECEVFRCLNAVSSQENIEAKRAWLALLANVFRTPFPHCRTCHMWCLQRNTMLTLEVTDTFHGPLPSQTGELCGLQSPQLTLFSTVRMHAYYDALLILLPLWSQEREKASGLPHSPLLLISPNPMAFIPEQPAFHSYGSSARCSIHLVSKPTHHSRSPWLCSFLLSCFLLHWLLQRRCSFPLDSTLKILLGCWKLPRI